MIFSRRSPHNLAFILLSESSQCFHAQPAVGVTGAGSLTPGSSQGPCNSLMHVDTPKSHVRRELEQPPRAWVKHKTAVSSRSQGQCRKQWLFFPERNLKCSCGTAAREACGAVIKHQTTSLHFTSSHCMLPSCSFTLSCNTTGDINKSV